MGDKTPTTKYTTIASPSQIQAVLAKRAEAQASGDKAAYKLYNDAYQRILKTNKAANQQSLTNQIDAGKAKFDVNAWLNNPSSNVYVDANGKPLDISKQITATGAATSLALPSMDNYQTVGQEGDLSSYSLVATSKKGYALGQKDPQGNFIGGPRGIYVDPKDPSRYVIGTVDQVVEKIINDYKAQPDGIKNLKRGLVANKQLTKAKASNNNDPDDPLRLALRKKVLTDSVNMWGTISSNKGDVTQLDTFNDKLTGGGSLTSTGVVSTMTDPAQLKAEATNFIKSMVGMNLDPKLAASYAAEINKREKSRPDKTTTTRDPLTGNTYSTGVRGGVTQEEKTQVMYKLLGKVVKNTPYEVLVKNGGKAVQDASSLIQYASAFGYKITTKDAVDRVVNGLAAGTDINAEKEKIKQATIARYGHLAKAIEAGSSLKDIANQYIYYKSQLMETPDTAITLDDPDIQAALDNNGKLMSTNDFQIRVRKNPLWAKTKNAREEAAGYANKILASFGLSA